MISIITCAYNRKTCDDLAEAAVNACSTMGIDCEVLLQTDCFIEVARLLPRLDDTNFLTLEIMDHTVPPDKILSLKQTFFSTDHLLVLILDDLSILAFLINTGIKPSAVLASPVDMEKIRENYVRILEEYKEAVVNDTKKISLTFRHKTYRLSVYQIVYIEAMEKKVNIYTKLQCIVSAQSLYEMKAMLDERFIQCHRSYIVNINSITSVDLPNMELELNGGIRIPISRNYRKSVEERIGDADARR